MMKYSKQSYKQILEYALDQGCEFVDFLSVDLGRQQKQVILRHDIDYSPAAGNSATIVRKLEPVKLQL